MFYESFACEIHSDELIPIEEKEQEVENKPKKLKKVEKKLEKADKLKIPRLSEAEFLKLVSLSRWCTKEVTAIPQKI